MLKFALFKLFDLLQRKSIGFWVRRTKTGWRPSRTTSKKAFDFQRKRHIVFDYLMPNLACDLMEPFRVFVDITAINTDLTVFEHEQKMVFVKLLNKEVKIDGQNNIMVNAVKIYVKSVFDAIGERSISLIKFPEYEL